MGLHPFDEAGQVVAGKAVVIERIGANVQLLVDNLLVLIKKQQLLVGFTDIEYGVNRLFQGLHHSPVDTLCLPR